MTEAESVKHESVLDTGAEQLGKTYAHALIGASEQAGATERVVEQLKQVVDDYIHASEPLAAAFSSPRIDNDEKIRVIDRVFGEDFDPVLVKFLKVMAGRGRLGFVASVRDAVEDIYDEKMGRTLATVRTAVALDEALRSQISEKLGAALNKDVRLKEEVDPDLIGGMVIRVGDTVFDNSVANRLDKMAKKTRDGFSSQLLRKFDQLISN
ncbi:MAG: ATP synthase F1 subunit delta [Pirellulaceae bacterium]|nr:ATP synthase F1 subunit delta [Pirellulaceae bacterium]